MRRRVSRWCLAGAGVLFGLLSYVYLSLPDVRPLATANPAATAFMTLRALEARAAGRPARRVQRWVEYRRISPNVVRAVLVAEDSAFYRHEGVDFVQLKQSVQANVSRGRVARGGSTITQQLAKNLYLTPARTPVRKLRELIIARRLEAALTKRRILELYLNVVEWGDGIYGIEAAARAYFRKPASALGAAEAALLAGALVNPRLLTPQRPTRRLLRRQRIILARMGTPAPPPRVTISDEASVEEPVATPPAEVAPPAEETAPTAVPPSEPQQNSASDAPPGRQ